MQNELKWLFLVPGFGEYPDRVERINVRTGLQCSSQSLEEKTPQTHSPGTVGRRPRVDGGGDKGGAGGWVMVVRHICCVK